MDFKLSLTDVWAGLERFLNLLLHNLDPSLFQNIILGILAIFIPFAIVFLTDVLDSKKPRSEFEKMVLRDEVLETKKVFWLSVIGLAFLAFFTGNDISITAKLVAMFFSITILLLLSKPLWKILRFSDGHGHEFEISFLQRLTFSKIFRFGNKRRSEKMIRAWNSLWSEQSIYDEREFTRIFIKHIDDAVKMKSYQLAVDLAKAYQNNLDKRDYFLIADEMLPKIFQWNEKLSKDDRNSLNREQNSRSQTEFFSRCFATAGKWIPCLHKQEHAEADTFWNWHYFQQELFPATAKYLLSHEFGIVPFFFLFEKHIDEAEANQEEDYVRKFLGIFCRIFFENIDSVPYQFQLAKDVFPEGWKITTENSQKRVPKILAYEFFRWAERRVLNKTDHDKELPVVIMCLFPSENYQLFQTFLTLLFCRSIKKAIQNKLNFFSKEPRQEEQSQRNKTIDVIFEYFGQDWEPLKLYQNDLAREELKDWEGYSETKKKMISDRVRKVKLQVILDELHSEEIKNLCQESEEWERQRNNFVDLIQALLERISQRVPPTTI